MELFFLGTSAGMPTKQRNVTALVLDLSHLREGSWLFDCGEGTQQQFMHSPHKVSKIKRIFITHLHGDHIFGLPGILTHRSMQNITHELHVYGPTGINAYIEHNLSLSSSHLRYPLHVHEFSEESLLIEQDTIQVSCHALNHRVPSYAYRITEKVKTQRVLVICGDNQPTDNHFAFAKGANVLVHEASYMNDLEHKAIEYGHATANRVAQLAQQAQVKQLIITHISPRYKRTEQDLLLQQCQQVFSNTLLAHDMMVFKVP